MSEKSAETAGDAAGRQFWEDAWSRYRPVKYEGPVFQFCDLAKRYVPKGDGKKAVELGAMPGNHLVYFNKEFGYRVTAIDYVSDVSVLRETFKLNDIGDYEVINQDLFSVQLDKEFDLVFSSGLVEHFDDPSAIMDKHFDFLRPGGVLFIGVPNTRYLHWLLMSLFCKKLLDVHRTHLMSPRALRRFAEDKGMDVLFCDFITTFRVFYPTPVWFRWIERAVIKALKIVKMNNVPNRFASPFLFLIAKRSARTENV